MHAILGLCMALWPVAVCAALRFDCLRPVLMALAVVFLLRAFILRGGRGILGLGAMAIAVAGVCACVLTLLSESHAAMLWYPVAVNLIMLAVFGGSLLHPPAAVTRLAALSGERMTPAVTAYTVKVTRLWCVFFIVNGSIAAFTVLCGDLEAWMWWNGCLSYIAIAVLMALEYFVRRVCKKTRDVT